MALETRYVDLINNVIYNKAYYKIEDYSLSDSQDNILNIRLRRLSRCKCSSDSGSDIDTRLPASI